MVDRHFWSIEVVNTGIKDIDGVWPFSSRNLIELRIPEENGGYVIKTTNAEVTTLKVGVLTTVIFDDPP